MESYQIQSLLEMLIVSAASIASLWIVSRAWINRRQVKGSDPKLIDAIEKMHQGIEGMRDELADVADRLEFTERVLGRLAEGNQDKQQLPRS